MSYASTITSFTPYVYWRMSGTSSPVQDETATNIDLTVGGGVTFGQAGPIADAIAFDGVNAYGDVPSIDLSDASSLTVIGFVYIPSYTDNNAPLIEFAPTWDLTNGSMIVNPNNTVEAGTWTIAYRGGGGISRWTFPQSAVSTGAWHHLVIRINRTANTLAVFVDGAAVTLTSRTSAASGGNFASSEWVFVTRSGLYMAASLAEWSIHKAALSDANIATIYAAAIPEIPLLPYHSTNDRGGAIAGSLPSTVGAFFSPPTNAQRIAGLTDYRCLYVKNLSADTLADVRVWLQTPSAETDAAEAIGKDTTNPAHTIVNFITAPSTVTFSAPTDYAGGLTLGSIAQNASVPVWVRRTISAGAAANDVTFSLGLSWTGAVSNALVNVAYEIVVPSTFYVDADSSARSDAWTRDQAKDDPTKPFATMQAAAMIVQRGDIIQVEPSTLGNANPFDLHDPNIYQGIVSNGNTIVLPAANNTGQDTITVRGHIVGGVRPKYLKHDLFQVNNWTFEDLQKGYDRGSGADYLTVSGLQDCVDHTINNVLSTGGGWRCIAGSGTMRWYRCITYAPFLDGNSNFMNGMGMNILGLNTGTGVNTVGDWIFEECHFEQVEGEDCIQCALGQPESSDPIEQGGTLTVLHCSFKDIILNPDLSNPPHTDCIQLLGVRDAKVWGNRFTNVIQALIASDNMNGRISMLNNIVDGTQNGMGVQGTQNAVFVHNTIKALFSGIAVGNRIQETLPGFETNLIIANNVTTSIGIDGGTNVASSSIIESNVCYQAPGQIVQGVAQLNGLPEFGNSARLVSVGLVTGSVSDWGDPSGLLELSNSPTESVGIGDGRSLSGLGLTADEIAFLSADALGRAYATPRDAGALQSDPGTVITPAPRPAYVINRSPAPNAVGVDPITDVTFSLVPPPGQQMNGATVSPSTVFLADAATSIHLPATVTLGSLSGGAQVVTINPRASLSPLVDGALFPLVLYTVTLDGLIDTQGSELPTTSWSFRVVGTGGPAISRALHKQTWNGSAWS